MIVGRLLAQALALVALSASSTASSPASDHTNNWAVLVCTSRFWFNYRHMANTLGMYRTVKRLGIPDSNIILMLADDVACNPRNSFPATVYANADRKLDLYGDNIEVDYRGYEVSVESFIRLMTGRTPPSTPRSKRLLTDDRSNIFVYMTGHGGNEFLKFQDNEEISAFDIADAFEQMWEKKRYNWMLFMTDTCQANTLYSQLYSPNILATGSSRLGENSYSHHNDPDIGVAVIDSYTHYLLEFMEGQNKTSTKTMKDLASPRQFDTYSFDRIHSNPGIRTDLFPFDLDTTLLTDFFGGVAQVDVDADPPAADSLPDSGALPMTTRKEVPFRAREGLALGVARKEAEEKRRAKLASERRWIGWQPSRHEGAAKVAGSVDWSKWVALPLLVGGLGSCFALGR